jgi:hypothetical protein
VRQPKFDRCDLNFKVTVDHPEILTPKIVDDWRLAIHGQADIWANAWNKDPYSIRESEFRSSLFMPPLPSWWRRLVDRVSRFVEGFR